MGETRVDLLHLLEDLRDAYHIALAAALALAPLAVEPAHEHAFVTAFLTLRRRSRAGSISGPLVPLARAAPRLASRRTSV